MNLIIFDLDGTLIDRDSEQVLPGVKEWFDAHQSDDTAFALCTNQGGVGLRYWMERDGFGERDQDGKASKYPDEAQARAHIDKAVKALSIGMITYVCFTYQSQKSGKWSPCPPGQEDDPEWSPRWRKPNSGMLVAAILDFIDQHGVPEIVTFVGNGAEDMQAAVNATSDMTHATPYPVDVVFQSAESFFALPNPF